MKESLDLMLFTVCICQQGSSRFSNFWKSLKKKLQIFYHFSKATASAEALFFP